MTQPASKQSVQEQNSAMQRYYKLQSKIYDATRWAFLFGRKRILRELPFTTGDNFDLLEVGCGTGFNLRRLVALYPKATLIGLDVSSDMITLSRKATRKCADRVELRKMPYQDNDSDLTGKLDAVLFSYSLTMINPQWESLIHRAKKDLKPGGVIAVVDFHNSTIRPFKKHMGNHHVRMDGHLLPVLEQAFEKEVSRVQMAYFGLWEIVTFIGKKK
jgi:S-adenosylmethionine-diacylgycerolhomoserine-N-methlytransferase